MIIEQVIAWLGSYAEHMDDEVSLRIDGRWYLSRVRYLPDIEHLLSVHPIRDGKINCRFDTGLCDNDALANDIRPAEAYLGATGATLIPENEPRTRLKIRWNPQAHNDGTRLFYGGFEPVEDK